MLEAKASSMSEAERHGCIAIDEMALQSRTSFDKNYCQVHGIVNLGGLESEADKQKRGDHALVVLFQPFRGRRVQAAGAFLSAGAVKGVTLHKFILEAVGLLEKSGYYVDCITTDRATWNRTILIKPPRGSNVTGSEILQALLDLKDLEGEKNKESMEALLSRVDAYLDCDVEVGNLEEMDHLDSLTASIDPYPLTVFGGYISRKMRKMQPAKG
ncbi:Glutamine--tRNA ligase [Frankliniella fusca]|uniref:Glutamine--tRNA ligase n=1 Tax=Frankliniella fusca TaxID=407009 RepID=A0AAE1LUG1_9NEOP|nr:Glutamine--tRNA ligase [Frankliniella fusca]